MAEVELTYTVIGQSHTDVILSFDPGSADAEGSVLVTGASGTYETLDAAANIVHTDTIMGIFNSNTLLHADNRLNLLGNGQIVSYAGIAFSIDNEADSDDNQGHIGFGAEVLGGYSELRKGHAVDVSLQAASYSSSNTVYGYDADGNVTQSVTTNDDGSHSIEIDANNKVVRALGTDRFEDFGTHTRFVFGHGFGADVIDGFQASGPGHDILSLPNSDAGRLGQILAHATGDGQGDTTLHLGHGDTITLAGVSKGELKAHRSDFAFHA